MANRRSGRPPARNQTNTAGDFTGRERERLLQENAAEVAEAQKRVGLMTAQEEAAEEHGIFDPGSQEVVGGFDDIEEAAEGIVYEEDDDVIHDPEAEQTNPLDRMKDLQDTVTQKQQPAVNENPYEIPEEPPPPVGVRTTQAPLVVFRVNSDVEDMTFGREVRTDSNGEQIIGELRNLSFYRGRRYKAPRDIYDHLEERGLIYH